MIRRKKGKIALVLSTIFLFELSNCYTSIPKAEINSSKYVTIDPSIQYQEFEGWGTSLCWWANMVGDWDMTDPSDAEGRSKREVLSELLFDSEKGLGINIVRYNIGGGDNPDKEEHPEHITRIEGRVPGYKESADSDYNWEADKAQLGILEDAKNILGNDDLKVEVFSNSPPWYMTQSGCNTGNFDSSKDNLKSDQYEEFTQYLADVTEYINNEKGIEVDYLEPVNEPASSYWGANSTKQEGCHFNQGTSQSKIFEELKKKLDEKGLSDSIELTGTDETSIDVQIESINKLSEEALGSISKINTHAYGGSKRGELRDLAYTLDKDLWMSEVCVSNADHDHDDVVSALELSDIILDDLNKMNAEAWVVWQAVESETENYLWDNNYGLIHGMYETADDLVQDYHIDNGFTPEVMAEEGLERGSYFLTKQYYVFGQFSKFIRPGYKIIDTDNDNVVAAMSPEGDEMVVVVQNNSSNESDFSFILDKTNVNNIRAYRTSSTESLDEVNDFSLDENIINSTIPANSIETFVISTEAYNKGTVNIVNDGVLGNDLNKFNYSDEWTRKSGQSNSYTSDTHATTAIGSKVSFKFNGTRIKVLGTKSPEGGEFKVYIDGEERGIFNSYDVSELEGETLVDIKELSQGEHTIELELINEGKKLEVDCAQIINGDISSNSTKPIISDIGSWGERMTLTVRPLEGAEKYKVYYGNLESGYEVKESVTNKNICIENLELNKVYNVYVTAVINGEETEASNSTDVKTSKVNDSNILYYVDCGDPTVSSVEQAGEEFGLRNSLEDQAFGVDKSSGYKWGYTSTNGTWSNGSYDRFDSVRCDTSDEAFGNITYKFELDDSKYRVVLGFTDPWNNKNRYMDILLENEVKELKYKTDADTYDTKTYENVEVKDGMLEVTVRRSEGINGGSEDPHISWILIEDMSNKSVVNVGTIENVVTSTGVNPQLPNEVEVEYSDGTKGIEKIEWDNIDETLLNTAFVYASVEGNIGANKVKTNVLILPEDLTYFAQCGGTEDSSMFYEVQENYNILNEEMDKVYEDGSWGYIETEPNSGTYAVGDIFNSVRYANTDELSYKFNIENGEYKVALGFMDPWGNYGRTSDININETEVDSNVVVTTSPMIRVYDNIVIEDGSINVNLETSSGTSEKPVISFIMISPVSEEGDIKPEVTPVEGITLDTTEATILVGETIKLNATVNPENATNKDIVWSTSNEAVATVDEDGKVTAKSAGTTEITVTTVNGSFSATSKITVGEAIVEPEVTPVESIVLDRTEVTLLLGEGLKLNATVNPENATNKDIVWSTSNEAVATVDEDGNVTAKSAGTTEITVTTVDGSFSAICKIKVNEKQVEMNAAPEINASDVEISVGNKFDPMKNVTAIDKEDGDITSSIKVVENTVDTNKAGTYKVVYSVTDSNGATTTKEIKVVVKAKKVEVVDNNATSKPNNNTEKLPQTGNALGVISMILGMASVVGGTCIGKKKK